MDYQFLAGEGAADGIRRVALEQIDRAIAEVEDDGLDVDTTIHQVRKRCKKLRALVRLVRPGMEKVYRRENAWYRDSARTLSTVRDARALVASCDGLLAHFEEAIVPGTFDPLRQGMADRWRKQVAANQDLERLLEEFLHRMRQGRERVAAWPLAGKGFDLLEAGLEKTYRRGSQAMSRAYERGTDEAFHEWRKRVKYHWYHLRLLQVSWPETLVALEKEQKRLSDLIGDDHDLAVLRQALAADPDSHGGRTAVQAFIGLVDRRQAELRLRARPLGARLYADKPAARGRRLCRFWQAWQDEQDLRPAVHPAGPVLAKKD